METAGAAAACSRDSSSSSWLVFTISVAAAKCGIGTTTTSAATFLSLSVFLLLAYVLLCLLCWVAPGGPAWGRYWLLTRCRWGPSAKAGAAPPGPRGVPILGSMELMSGLAHRHLARAAASLKAERLMAFSLGETRAVVTADPDVAKEILQGDAFNDRPNKESAYGLMFHRSIGFAPYGDYWRALRRIAAGHLFCPPQIAVSGSQRAEIAAQLVAALKTKSDAASSSETSAVCVRDVLKQAALNNVMWSVFGKRYDVGEEKHNRETAELRYLVEEGYDLLGILNWSDHLALLARFDLQGIRARCEAIMPRVNAFVGPIIEEHRRQRRQKDAPRAAATRDFVDVMLSMQESQGGLSDQDILAVLWEMIFRGTDTVAVLLEWVLARVTIHPDVQEKLHGELDTVVGRSRVVEERDVAALPYLQAVLKETLRVHPPGPLMSWARLSTRDTTVDGRHVPKGTIAMVNMWAITHDPRVWDRPDEFLPDRFLEMGNSAGAAAPAAPSPPLAGVFGTDLRLAPFGSGKRGCPGKAMGMATVEFWLASLLHEFEWFPPAAGGGAVDLSERLRLSCEMEVPLTVGLVPRRR